MSNDNFSDKIISLPTDNSQPTQSEVQVMDTLFKKQQHFNQLFSNIKEILLAGVLFMGFALPVLDKFIQRIFPTSESSVYILVFIKTLLFMISFFIIKNLYIVRNAGPKVLV